MAAPSSGPGPVVANTEAACTRFEVPVTCGPCGACCREAFDAVPVEPTDPTHTAHPDMVRVADDGWCSLRRVPAARGTRCAALLGTGAVEPFTCRIYSDRPTACRELEPGSANCLMARRRVGLSWGDDAGPQRAQSSEPVA